MSARRVLAGSAVALLLPASLLLTVETGSATDSAARPASTSVTKKASQKISLEVLPQIVQQGKRTASADSAKGAVTATIKPVKVGRKVVLERLVGTSWKKVGTAKQEKSGRANFSAAVSSGGAALTYRVTAQKFKGLKKVSSTSADTTQWLAPTFTDEFSGSTLSPVWSMRGQEYEPQSKRKCSKGDPKAVKVGSGALRLSVIKDKSKSGKCTAKSRKQTKKISYRLNGHVGTEHSFAFTYGFAAARIKTQPGRGQHAAFWMQAVGGQGTGGPKKGGAEIDVIEWFGDGVKNGGLASFIYMLTEDGPKKVGGWIEDPDQYLADQDDSWFDAYHVFSVEWTPDEYIFRIDGQETWRTDQGISHQPQYPILSLLSSDYELENLGKVSNLPQTMQVDWLKFWEA